MSIILSLVNPNTQVLDKIEIYRATSKTGALTLIDTVAGNALTYTDTTAPINAVSWYVVRAYLGGVTSDSKRTALGWFPDPGPGPGNIIRGNWEFGYFGTVTDLTTMPRLADMSAINSAITPVAAYTNSTIFHKWVIGGKIVYIPESYYYANSNQNGWGAFQIPAGTAQSAIPSVTKGLYKFAVRPPYASTLLGTTKAAVGTYVFGGSSGNVSAEDGTLAFSELTAIMKMFSMAYTVNTFFNTKFLDLLVAGLPSVFLTTITYTDTGGILAVNLPQSTGASVVTKNVTDSSAMAYWPIFELQF